MENKISKIMNYAFKFFTKVAKIDIEIDKPVI